MTSRDCDGIEMQPAVLLPRKHQTIAIGPQDLRTCFDAAKRAAGTFVCMPSLAAGSGGCVGNPDGPRGRSFPHRTDGDRGGIGTTEERNASAIGAPYGRAVAIDAGIQISNAFVRD